MNPFPIKIGTRDSQLALCQAKYVKIALEKLGYTTTIIPIKSSGDLNLTQPLYEIGIVGIFTKTLDIAMLNGEIDIAVHSMKDVPTTLPKGIVQSAVLKREKSFDILITKNKKHLTNHMVIATSSLRRKAQWLHRYPDSQIENLRGNLQLRFKKLQNSFWDAMILAQAGVSRLNIIPEHYHILDWMIPAPAQGSIMIVAREENIEIQEVLNKINDIETQKCTHIERNFLKTLEGGCTTPIGALAKPLANGFEFEGVLLSEDGKKKVNISKQIPLEDWENAGHILAKEILEKGGKEIISEFKKNATTIK